MELVEKLKKIIVSEESGLKCLGCGWQYSDKPDLERKNITSSTNTKKYKYIEYTKLGSSDKVCVAIGFNPAEFDVNEFDGTNNKICTCLKEKYGSYILINLYPQVSKTKDEWDEGDEEDAKFAPVLIKLLETILDSKEDVLVFWGRSVGVDEQIGTHLSKMQENNLLYFTVKKGTNLHYHPARVAIDIKKATKESLIKTTSIL